MENLSVSGGGTVSNSTESIGTTSMAVSADEEFEHDLDALSNSALEDLLHRIITANVKLTSENKLLEDAIKETEQSKGSVALDEKGGSLTKTSTVQSSSADSRNSLPDISELDSGVYPSDRRKSRFRSMLVEIRPVLSVQYKCYIASKKLGILQSILENLEKSKDFKINDLKAKLEEISIETAAIEDERYLFDDSIRIKGKHAITKKVMAEKVQTYFENNLKKKLIVTERLRMQTSFSRMLRKKVISEMEEKQLDKEISDLAAIVKQISWQERLKRIILYEESSFYQKKIEYETAKQKIMTNAKKKYVPGVMEYVHLKARIKEKEKAVHSWKSKVAVAEQAKFLHLSAQRYL